MLIYFNVVKFVMSLLRDRMGPKEEASLGRPTWLNHYVQGRGPKSPQNLFIKNCVFILTCLNFSHLQSSLHLMQCAYGDVSTARNSL